MRITNNGKKVQMKRDEHMDMPESGKIETGDVRVSPSESAKYLGYRFKYEI